MYREHLSAQLLRTSKAVYRDALPYLYKSQVFTVMNLKNLDWLLPRAEDLCCGFSRADFVIHVETSLFRIPPSLMAYIKTLHQLQTISLHSAYYAGNLENTRFNWREHGFRLPLTTQSEILAAPREFFPIRLEDVQESFNKRAPRALYHEPLICGLLRELPHVKITLTLRYDVLGVTSCPRSHVLSMYSKQCFRYKLKLGPETDGIDTLIWDPPALGMKTVGMNARTTGHRGPDSLVKTITEWKFIEEPGKVSVGSQV